MQHEKTGKSRWGRPIYRTLNSVYYVYEIPDPDGVHGILGLHVYVPRGFLHDFASIPWPLHYLMPPNGPWSRAAVVHDRLCVEGVPRFLADAVFRHIMEQDGVKMRCVLYYAVRIYWVLFGHWFHRRKKDGIPS